MAKRLLLTIGLGDGTVDGGERVHRGHLRPDVVAVTLEGDLAELGVGDAGVLLPAEADLGPLHVEEPPQAGHLVLGQLPQLLRHVHLPTADDDVHAPPPGSGVRVGGSGPP
jgi:hypothetical protein